MKNRLRTAWHLLRNMGQCNVCSGWFDNWPGGTCAACLATGRT
ncbi:hypothetical protein ACFV0T_26245 [Streptomyces sp. NPDC059582]